MMYRCRILTDEFLIKLDKYIQTSTADIKDEDKRKKKKTKMRNAMYYMWNNPQAFVDKPNVQKYYENLGLWLPEYNEMLISPVGRLHLEPHITWVGKVCKIKDVKEIFSYEPVT